MVERLVRDHKEPAAVVAGLYLSALSRRPTAEETAEAVAFIERRQDLKQGAAALLWTLVNSTEFIASQVSNARAFA